MDVLYRMNQKKFKYDTETAEYIQRYRINIDIVCQPDPNRPGRAFLYSTTVDSLPYFFTPLSIYNPIIKTYNGKTGYELNRSYSRSHIPWFHNKLAYKGFLLTNFCDREDNTGYEYTSRNRFLIEIDQDYLFERPLRDDRVIKKI